MDRKKFLVGGVSMLGLAAVAPKIFAAVGNNGEEKGTCVTSPIETEGPFPTQNPSSLQQVNIVGDRTGVSFEINITIVNTDNNCAPLEGAYVDIWHCDKDGNYSQYGGTSMQSADYTAYNFLRGRQQTDSNGEVSYVSIFPGWYTSRATHIHVHVYDEWGTSLLVTQISFPEGTNSIVEQVNAATAYGYTKGMTGYTYNATDNVFSDDTNDTEMCSVAGSVSGGIVLTHQIGVAAGTTAGIDTNEAIKDISVVYPNPITSNGYLDILLNESAHVKLRVFDLKGRLVDTPFSRFVDAGQQTLAFDRGTMTTGIYLYTISVETENDIFEKSGKLIVQ